MKVWSDSSLLKKSVAFSCGLCVCQNQRKEKQKGIVERKESCQKRGKETEDNCGQLRYNWQTVVIKVAETDISKQIEVEKAKTWL